MKGKIHQFIKRLCSVIKRNRFTGIRIFIKAEGFGYKVVNGGNSIMR
jgi:hypothetical protein